MNNSCMIYIARLKEPFAEEELALIRDQQTRQNARDNVSGLRVLCTGWMFGIMQGQTATLEKQLDRLCEIDRIEEPEILFFAPIRAPLFTSWSLHTLPSSEHQEKPIAQLAQTLRMLSEQAMLTPDRLSLVIPKIEQAIQLTMGIPSRAA